LFNSEETCIWSKVTRVMRIYKPKKHLTNKIILKITKSYNQDRNIKALEGSLTLRQENENISPLRGFRD